MAREPLRDKPNRLHHLINRGARRQILFSDRRDICRFLAILACAVRRRRQTEGAWPVALRRKQVDAWLAAKVGPLQSLACSSRGHVCAALEYHRATAARGMKRHRELLRSDPT